MNPDMIEDLKACILKMFRPGNYILFNKIQERFPLSDRKELNKDIRNAIKFFIELGIAKKGYGGNFYLISPSGETPFYGKGIKLSKYRMSNLSRKDIGKKCGKKGISILKAKSEDSNFDFYNYSKKRKVKNKLSSKKCRICNGDAYCMHHILPLSKVGDNSAENLIPVCRSCHSKIHPFMGQK